MAREAATSGQKVLWLSRQLHHPLAVTGRQNEPEFAAQHNGAPSVDAGRRTQTVRRSVVQWHAGVHPVLGLESQVLGRVVSDHEFAACGYRDAFW